jgi:hypothetical protein
MLQIRDKGRFITELTENMPPSPDHFGRCSEVNRKGPALLSSLAPVQSLDPRAAREKIAHKVCDVLDTRRYDAFGSAHIPKS